MKHQDQLAYLWCP